jgi:type VI secretion system Hcp family effector
MSFRRYQKADKDRTRKRRPQNSDAEDWQSAKSPGSLSPNAVIQLQRTIGNQAVQRLIGSERLHDTMNGAIQRDNAGQEAASTPILATLIFDRQGTIKGNSRIAGHEGKVEVLSLHRDVDKPSRNPDEPTPTNLMITRNVDELSNQFARANIDGDPLKTAQFEFTRRNDEGKVEIAHSLEFSDGLISSYSVSGGEKAMEQIGMDFRGKSS